MGLVNGRRPTTRWCLPTKLARYGRLLLRGGRIASAAGTERVLRTVHQRVQWCSRPRQTVAIVPGRVAEK
jgi:hypothetical protein